MKVKVISLPYIFQVLYVLCFTGPRYQVSVYRTIGPLVLSAVYDPILMILADNEDMHKSLVEFKLCQDLLTDCPLVSKKSLSLRS